MAGAGAIQQIDAGVAFLGTELTDDGVQAPEQPSPPRDDRQGISDEAETDAIRERVPGMAL
ncbi:hypothetical protein [Streptomyces sp. 8L]|uniref:hypothetical protein n=1 Tax=Streptomyces sp. 8L TaxID=2877242 RepID=UPI001CD69B7B|nr:hypothetical protein [Streptomyces sp. 8L]MCA1217783.1 hypothetical protein [Streptomyces sp. 8L]